MPRHHVTDHSHNTIKLLGDRQVAWSGRSSESKRKQVKPRVSLVVQVLTGDSLCVAKRICADMGIDNTLCTTGVQL